MSRKYLVAVGAAVVFLVLLLLIFLRPKEAKVYTVEFDSNSAVAIEKIEVNEGETVKKPTDPVKEGYIFIGWECNGQAFDFSMPIKENIKLTAKWQEVKNDVETFTIQFNTNGGSTVQNQVIEKGSKVEKPVDPQKDGYEFKGWFVDNKEYDFDKDVTSDLTIEAKWEKEEETKPANSDKNKNSTTQTKKYTVTFNSNGGSSVASQTVSEGSKATQPTTPTRSGYTFKGWTLNGSSYNFNSSVTSNITLVATWTQKTYTIKVSSVDEYSPDRVLTVYENGTQISVSEIRYLDGDTLCSGSNTTVNKNDIAGENSFIVVLNGGTTVTASVS